MAGLGAPQGDTVIRGAPPRAPTVRELYMRGFTPHPDLGSFFGKKLPKNPKKPDCIGFRLSSIDSKQGCRTAALLFVERKMYLQFICEILKLKIRSSKNIP